MLPARSAICGVEPVQANTKESALQRNPSSRRPPVLRTPQQPRPVVQQPRKKKLGPKQVKRGALPR